MPRILFFLLVFCVGDQVVKAQQLPQYTLNMLDKYRSTIGYGGMDASLQVVGTIRSQWLAFPGQPRYQSISAHLPLYIINGGAGILFTNDDTGLENNLTFRASYNYVLETGIGLLSFGAGFGLTQKKINGDQIRTPDGLYEGNILNHQDPLLPLSTESAIAPTTALGVYFDNGEFNWGIGVENIFEQKVEFSSGITSTLDRVFQGFFEYHYFYNEELEFIPFAYAKTNLSQLQAELSVMARYQNQYFGGIGIRGYSAKTFDSIQVFFGLNINPKTMVAYSFDAAISSLKDFEDGTHELILSYNLGKPIGVGKPQPVIHNPRF